MSAYLSFQTGRQPPASATASWRTQKRSPTSAKKRKCSASLLLREPNARAYAAMSVFVADQYSLSVIRSSPAGNRSSSSAAGTRSLDLGGQRSSADGSCAYESPTTAHRSSSSGTRSLAVGGQRSSTDGRSDNDSPTTANRSSSSGTQSLDLGGQRSSGYYRVKIISVKRLS